MNCESKKCKKAMSTPIPCTKCLKKFCAKACMIDHFFEAHLNDSNNAPNQLDSVSINRKNSISSLFLKTGKFLKEFVPHPDYNFSMFEKVKSGTAKNAYYVLGSGGFGEVFLCKHKEKKFYAAIKEMNKKRILDAGHKLDIIYKEINYNGRLLHENIIKLYSFWEDENNIYLIMEYADSGNLFNMIRKNSGFEESEAFKYFVQVCSAVNFIHENNLIHRDLKPENILVCENEILKLCDFGWCVELSIGNRSTFCGTYEYMAPEIIREKPYNHGIDVWSLGVLLYELLHGYSPFKAEVNYNDCYEVFDNIVKYNLKFDKALSDDCKDLIIKLLSPDSKSRIKVKEIFDHPWFRNYENIILESTKKMNEKKRVSENLKISEFDYSTNKKPENKIVISVKNKEENKKNLNNKISNSNNNLINVDMPLNKEGNPNPIDSYKSSKGFNMNEENFDSLNPKGKLNLKSLRKDIGEEKNFSNNLKENLQNKNKVDLNKSSNENINNNDKKYDSIDPDNPHNFNEKSKIIIKKKKKILVAKTPNEENNLKNIKNNSNENSTNENAYILNYKNYKISAVKYNKNDHKSGISNNNKSNIEKSSSELHANKFNTNLNNSKNKNNIMEINNEIISDSKLNGIDKSESKTTKNCYKIMNFASEKLDFNKKQLNKSNNKTATDILLGDLSPNHYNKNNSNKFINENNNNDNFINYQNNNNNFNLDKKLTLDFNEKGYDLENFIQKQNSKKSKMGHLSSHKSPGYKDGNTFENYNSKNKPLSSNILMNNHLNENSENENNNYHNYITNENENDEYDKNFSKLIQLNSQKNKMDKSMDRSFNDISRDQIMDKINRNKNKSIINALNKTENEIEKFDNNNMNSSVIDVVFSKIEGKNKNKHKNKDNDTKKKTNYDIPADYFYGEEKNDFNFADFTIKNYIKDDEEKENKNEFQLFNNETEGNEDNNNNFYVTKNLGKMTLKDFQSKKYETARENNKHDFENQNYVSKSDLTSNKKNKSSEKDNLKNNLGKNRKDIMDNSKNTLDKNEDIFNVIPRESSAHKYKNVKTNELEVENLIKNFQTKPSSSNKADFSNKNSTKSSIEFPGKKSVSNKNNNNDIFISNSNHIRNKSNNNIVTPNDEEVANEKSKENNNSRSKEKMNKPPKDKKAISSVMSNNNELLYSKDFKNRDSQYNKSKKANGEKNKLGSISRDYGNLGDNQVELHRALDLLEQANESKNNGVGREQKDDSSSKWEKFINFFNPFKCG